MSAALPARRVLVPAQLTRTQLYGVGSGFPLAEAQGATMGTYWTAKVLAPSSGAAWRELIEGAFTEVIRQMSGWSEESDLMRFSRAPAGSWHVLPPEFFQVLARAVELARDTGGAYDPTVGELVDLLGFGPGNNAIPAAAGALEAARRRAGWSRLQLDPTTRRALQPGGVHLDLSSIAKGFAVDLAAERLVAAGVENFLLDVGGEVRGRGCKPDGQPWWCFVERPPGPPGTAPLPETVVALCGGSLATSGDYRRRRSHGGREYSHLIDPRTGGQPAPELTSVTVLGETCMDADGYATALFVLGVEAGLAWAGQRGLAALFVSRSDEGLSERWTPAWAGMLA